MTMKVSRRGLVDPFVVMDVMRDAALLEEQGRSIIHLEVGQPSTGLPESVKGKLNCHIREEPLGYTVAQGIPQLRDKISAYYKLKYDVEVDPTRVFITAGSSAAFQLALIAAFDVGDRIAIAAPGYPAYRHIASSLGLEPVLVEVGADTRYQPTTELLEPLANEIDGLIIASPSNPTGTVIPPKELMRIVTFCESHNIRLLSDEIYHGIAFGTDTSTVSASTASSIVINSFSKYFSMTGWRIGWMVVPEDLMRSVECLAQNHYISPPTLSQWAALYALDATEELDTHVERYRANRSILLQGLTESGVRKLAPSDGAFYLYADVSEFAEDSAEFCRRLLHEGGVATTPGHDFDPIHGRKFVRLSFAGTTSDMVEAVNRIGVWLPRL